LLGLCRIGPVSLKRALWLAAGLNTRTCSHTCRVPIDVTSLVRGLVAACYVSRVVCRWSLMRDTSKTLHGSLKTRYMGLCAVQ